MNKTATPGVPIIDAASAGTSSLAEAAPELGLGGQSTERLGQIAHRLLGRMRGHLDANLIRDLQGCCAEIEADHRPAGRHRLEARPTAGILQARMNQEMALLEHLAHLGAGDFAEKANPVGDSGLTRERAQPPALRTAAHDPVFGVRQRRLGERAQPQRKAAARSQPADADQPDRLVRRHGQARERVDLIGPKTRFAA